MIKETLICHPETASPLNCQLEAAVIKLNAEHIQISYQLTGDTSQLLIPEQQISCSSDNLWQQTCFELFIAQTDAESYYEFNFSPSNLWAAYAFDCYRVRREWVIKQVPSITVSQSQSNYQLDAVINMADLELLSAQQSWLIGLSAVLETQQHELSYWALKHPGAQPNFHLRVGYIPFTFYPALKP